MAPGMDSQGLEIRRAAPKDSARQRPFPDAGVFSTSRLPIPGLAAGRIRSILSLRFPG